MRIKLDENLPGALVEALERLGHEVDTVAREGLLGREDADVWAAAQADGRFLITHDLDFSDARRYRPGTHRGLLLLRLKTPARRRLLERVIEVFAREDVASWAECVVVLTDTKLRVRRPGRPAL